MEKSKALRGRDRVSYSKAGVDTVREEVGLQRLTDRIVATWPPKGAFGEVKLPIGYFANVIDIGGIGLALSADGVGSKVLIAQQLGKYDTVGIDCVAMNVNDLICVGAKPVSMVDYIALQDPSPDLLDGIAKGLCDGAQLAGISISGGEIAQLREIVTGLRPDMGFDLAGMAVGTVPLDKIIIGQDIQPNDVIVGIESNGIHSNGLTLARRAFFEQSNFKIDSVLAELEETLGNELLKPTSIYVKEVLEILSYNLSVKALIHITSEGFLNLTRVAADVGYVIDGLPEPPAIFSLIQRHGKITDEEMFRVYNMGIGFCIVVGPQDADSVLQVISKHGKRAHKIGYALLDNERQVKVVSKGKTLVGKDDRFVAKA